MRQVTVLLSINEHHLFSVYTIDVNLHLLSDFVSEGKCKSANRVGIARRVAPRPDEIAASRADKAFTATGGGIAPG